MGAQQDRRARSRGSRRGADGRGLRGTGGLGALSAGALVAFLLSGCGPLGDGPGADSPLDEDRITWQHDEASGRWYVPAAVSTDDGDVTSQFPALDPTVSVWTQGVYADPTQRSWLPAQDDHWEQGVLTLADEQRERLRAVEGAPVPDEEVAQVLVPTMEAAAGSCGTVWQDVTVEIADDGEFSRTATGLSVEMAAFCAESGVLALSMFET